MRFERALRSFEDAGAQVLGVSCDSVPTHKAFATHCGGVSYPLLADWEPKGAMARAYGLYNAQLGATLRSVVVVDRDGVIRYKKLAERGTLPDPAEVLAVVRSL